MESSQHDQIHPIKSLLFGIPPGLYVRIIAQPMRLLNSANDIIGL